MKKLCGALAIVLVSLLLYGHWQDRQETARWSESILAEYQVRTTPSPTLDYAEYVRDIMQDAGSIEQQKAERDFQKELAKIRARAGKPKGE